MEKQIIQELSTTGCHQECLQACQKLIENKPEDPFNWKYAGKSLLGLGEFKGAQEYLLKAHQLDTTDPETIKDIGNIFYALNNDIEAMRLYKIALSINEKYGPAINNLGLIAKRQRNLHEAEQAFKQAIDLDPLFAAYHMNLGAVYKDLGNLPKALAATIKSLELQPDSPNALTNLGRIKMGLGQSKEAKKDLVEAIKLDKQCHNAYFGLSMLLETSEDAQGLLKTVESAKVSTTSPEAKSNIEFTISNCYYKLQKHDQAATHLIKANEYKLIAYPSNIEELEKTMKENFSQINHAEGIPIDDKSGMKNIFIVGMPRSGSTLLETVLSMNHEIRDKGETKSLEKAIAKIKLEHRQQNLCKAYSILEGENDHEATYFVDKNLNNFMYVEWVAKYMPAAKIIHCRRNPLDNILSMYRSNLSHGFEYTSKIEDAAKILAAQELNMQAHKKNYPEKIYTFDYDMFVNYPEDSLKKLLEWLGLKFYQFYLHPEKSTRNINTASVMQARKPINNKSVGGWKQYKSLLKPAIRILNDSGIQVE